MSQSAIHQFRSRKASKTAADQDAPKAHRATEQHAEKHRSDIWHLPSQDTLLMLINDHLSFYDSLSEKNDVRFISEFHNELNGLAKAEASECRTVHLDALSM